MTQISPTRSQTRTRLYRDGRLELDGFPVADVSEYLADESVTIWLDLCDPDPGDLALGRDHRRPHVHHRLFGMNVPYPGFGQKAGLAAAVGIIALAGLVLYLLFKHNDWL